MVLMHILVVLDSSGSMEPRLADAIGSFNTFLREQQSACLPNEEMTLTVFPNGGTARSPIAKVRPLTPESYRPSGGTPLYDAILDGIGACRAERDCIVAIITDGEENASVKATGEQVKAAIAERIAAGWEVHYLGVGLDEFRANAVGRAVGSQTSGSFASSSAAFVRMSRLTSEYRESRDRH
jgi:hypothetical protein